MTGRTPYWWVVIDAAKRRGFRESEIARSLEWQTCACGMQDHRIRRHPVDQAPLDPALFSLGKAFYEAVNGQQPDMAAEILYRIEKRAAEVIADVLKKAEGQ